jgi:hypothetical protein
MAAYILHIKKGETPDLGEGKWMSMHSCVDVMCCQLGLWLWLSGSAG